MQEAPFYIIGRERSDFLKVTVLNRAHPQATDYWDGNWVDVAVDLSAGAFRGRYRASFRTMDFTGFRNELTQVHNVLDGTASFEPMEEQLTIRAKGDGVGHFIAECRAQDEAGIGNVLEFELSFDQTDIPSIVRALDSIIAAFPIIGAEAGHEQG